MNEDLQRRILSHFGELPDMTKKSGKKKTMTVEVTMIELNSDAGSPLRIPVKLDGLDCVAYLDTGAGVVVLGKGWLQKRRAAGLGEPTLILSTLELKGVTSTALAKTLGSAMVELEIYEKKVSKTVLVQGVVCPNWEGDIILSLNALTQLGFELKTDAKKGSGNKDNCGASNKFVYGSI